MLLHISNYGDINSGWAIAAQECIRALAKYVDVLPRRIKLAPQNPPQDILQMENRDLECKVCIQHCLPPFMTYYNNYYNIGVVFIESNSLGMTGWAQYLNLMDEIWTFSHHAKAVLAKEVTVPIRVFALPINQQMLYQAQSFNIKEQCQGDFLFYTIADFNRRKNLIDLVRAFHMEFAHWEPVNLLIKTNAPQQQVEEFCTSIKKGCKLYNESRFKKEVIISGNLDQQSIYSIHKSCDVFVLPSMGEGWSIPTQEALCLGKTPIVTNNSAFVDYISNDNGWLVPSKEVSCFNSTSIEYLHSGHETWNEPDFDSLRQCMREAYENHEIRQTKSINGMRSGLQFTYDNIGKSMFDVIKTKV